MQDELGSIWGIPHSSWQRSDSHKKSQAATAEAALDADAAVVFLCPERDRLELLEPLAKSLIVAFPDRVTSFAVNRGRPLG